jgi:hypothetical protein
MIALIIFHSDVVEHSVKNSAKPSISDMGFAIVNLGDNLANMCQFVWAAFKLSSYGANARAHGLVLAAEGI